MKVKITLVKPAARKFYLCKWIDPITGKTKKKSTEETRRKSAERFAARLEDKLNRGESICGTKTQWDIFTERYDTEVMYGQSERTREKAAMVLDSVKKIVSPKSPDVLDANLISQYVKALRESGKAESTIKGHLAYLKAALRWAAEMGIIPKAPAIKMPTRVNTAKGRAITLEEFERMIKKIPEVLEGKPRSQWVKEWDFFLRGLFWSGLRRSEAWHLHWTDDSKICVDLTGRFPMFRIQQEADKGFEARTFPIAPQFAEMLQAVPDDQRTGYVFNPSGKNGNRLNEAETSRTVGKIGKAAKVKVAGTQECPKYASAHDFRRSFGTRWSSKVMPAVLQQMMRHAEISTTMGFYVTQNANATADAMWSAFGTTSGTTNKKRPRKGTVQNAVTPYG